MGQFYKALISHLLERYGEEEVKTWYFELWNEPDIFYWNGTIAEYCKLYDYTERAIHEVCDELRISGPAVTGNFDREYVCRFFRDFLKHCKSGVNFCTGETGTRLDFITYHVKGGGFPFEMHAPKAVPSVERLVQLTKIGLDIICECGYQGLEVVLSEADPDGWAAGGVYDNANMIFRNTEYYATYVASTYEKIEQLCHEYRMAVRPLAWAFMFPEKGVLKALVPSPPRGSTRRCSISLRSMDRWEIRSWPSPAMAPKPWSRSKNSLRKWQI